MVLSVPVPSSRVNCNSFFDFGTATHSLTFTARKSDLLNVSKSTNSSNKGSTFTLEKSIFSDSVFTFFQVLQKLYYLHHFSYLHHLRTSLSGIKFCSLHPAPCRSVVRKIRIIAGFLKLFIIRPVSYLTVRFTRKVV